MEKGQNRNINSDKRSSVITIFILICIILIAFIGIGYQFITTASKPGYVSLSPINVSISSETGEHKVSVDVVLNGKSKDLNKIDFEKAQLIAKETIKNLDYDKIKQENGNEYIKNSILEELQKEFGDDIEKVTLSRLLTNVSIGEEGTENSNPSREELLENFGWSKKK